MSAVPLDEAPERRTKRCSPTFHPGGRFWSQVSDTCRQPVRERNVGPRPCKTDPFHPLGSISKKKSFLCIYQSVTSYLFHVVHKSVSLCGKYLTIAHVLLETTSTEPKNEIDYSSSFSERIGAYDTNTRHLLMCTCRKKEINNNLKPTYESCVSQAKSITDRRMVHRRKNNSHIRVTVFN